ncbi:uncharacterized protein N7515_002075 [Penicillium bovifimosum]|uniref:DUF7587 domain-containing protein n=1 Tax=Penicillium bovifimosum TaxID=126998 RepID=A0A9W9HD24_9EURO|nr:uncharacterized protein N7515_002075 [Penicillium bovifimosum]KAJ5143288.1 hypothetical protein N7515_002075 [Penicillium bovifimosum]
MEECCLPDYKIPEFLYRVHYDSAYTQETKKWLLAGDTGDHWRTRTIDEFEEAADCHLSNWHEPSIFISAFDHKARATDWMARHWWRCKVNAKVFEIDTTAIGHKYIYRAKSLARQLDMNTEGLDHNDLYYEYLVLHRIPKSAFRRCWNVTFIDSDKSYGYRVANDPKTLGTEVIRYERIPAKDKKVPGDKGKKPEEKKVVENERVGGHWVSPKPSEAS